MPETPDASEAIAKFCALAREVAAARAGRDFLVVEEECRGYETTPLESGILAAARSVVEVLKARPEALKVVNLSALLTSIVLCEPAVDEYRARYLGAAGDYADIRSPVAYATSQLLEALASALRRLEARDLFPLAAIEEGLLTRPVKLYRYACYTQALYEFVLSENMVTAEMEPFAGFRRRKKDELLSGLRALDAAPPEQKRSGLRMHVSSTAAIETGAVSETVAAVLPLLSGPDAPLRYEAQGALGRLGFAAVRDLTGPFLSSAGEVHERLFSVLETIAKECGSGERQAVLYCLFASRPPDPDRKIEARRRDLLRAIEPSEFLMSKVRPAASRVLRRGMLPGCRNPVRVRARTTTFYRQAHWEIFDDGDYELDDATFLTTLAPKACAGRTIVLCHDVVGPERHALMKAKTLVTFDVDADALTSAAPALFLSEVGPSLVVRRDPAAPSPR
jgi:hypothetical protein